MLLHVSRSIFTFAWTRGVKSSKRYDLYDTGRRMSRLCPTSETEQVLDVTHRPVKIRGGKHVASRREARRPWLMIRNSDYVAAAYQLFKYSHNLQIWTENEGKPRWIWSSFGISAGSVTCYGCLIFCSCSSWWVGWLRCLPILRKHMRWRWFMHIVSEGSQCDASPNFRAHNFLAHRCIVGLIFELWINLHHVSASKTQSRGVGLDNPWKNYLRCHAIHSKSSRWCGYNTAKIGWGRRLHRRPPISF
jgi:hypothetical protein